MRKKLPETIVLEEVNNQTYRYTDVMEMLDDLKRLRKKTGWSVKWVRTTETHFIFQAIGYNENPDEEPFAQFEVRTAVVVQSLWPSHYPREPMTAQLRRWFLARRGPLRVAMWVNETPHEVESKGATALSRLLDDEDLC